MYWPIEQFMLHIVGIVMNVSVHIVRYLNLCKYVESLRQVEENWIAIPGCC